MLWADISLLWFGHSVAFLEFVLTIRSVSLYSVFLPNTSTMTMVPHLHRMQDRGFSQKLEDACKNPTDGLIQAQLEKAQSSYADHGLETEESVVRLDLGRDHVPAFASGAGNPAVPKGKAKARNTRAGPDCGSNVNPLVAASRVRSRTMKDFCEAERNLKKAISDTHHVLDEVAPKLLSPEQLDNDPTLDLLKSRLRLSELASDMATGDEGKLKCKQLFALACEDPYLKDCRSTFLADEDACLTLGLVREIRNFQLDVYFGMIDLEFGEQLSNCMCKFVLSIHTYYIHTQAQTS